MGWTQDDSVEELDASMEEKRDLKQENDFLEFESHFISAVQERVRENPEKALDYLQTCEGIYPNHPAMLYEKAKTYFVLKNYDQSQDYCDRLLAQKPNYYWGKLLKRDILIAEQNLLEALIIQKQLYAENSNEANELLNLYARLNDKIGGIALLKEIDAKAIYVPNVEGFKRFFKVDNKIADFDEEEEDDDKTLLENTAVNNRGNTTILTIENDYKTLVNNKNFHQLFSISEQNMYKSPTEPLHYFYNGLALINMKKYKEAVEIIEMGLDFIFNDNVLKGRFYNQLIEIYSLLKNEAKVKYYRELVRQL